MAVVPNVATGELIQSSWGNTVANELNNQTMKRTGGTFTGIVNVGDTISSGNPAVVLNANGTMASIVGNTGTDAPSFQTFRAFNAAAVGQRFLQFTRGLPAGPTVVGSISIATTTTVAYNTTSDPRLKRVIGPVADALVRVRRLGVASFRGRWKQDEVEGVGVEWDMLSSHDVEDEAPYAVTGERDAVDGFGNVDPQQVDYSKLVPLLCAAIEELASKVEELQGVTG